MSNPEISRRCRACGASVRARAAFCPQCGRNLEENNAPSASAEHFAASPPPQQSEAFAHPRAESHDLKTLEGNTADAEAISANASNASARKESAAVERSVAVRATHKTNFVHEDDGRRGRGERPRETSVSRLDDAAADPGLRFVLVALVLFILFLLLLLLNSFVG